MIARIGVLAALTLSTFAATAPTALGTYRGRDGALAYQTDENNGSNVEFSGISSIPMSSAANCTDTSPSGDQGVNCSIGRFGYSPNRRRIVAARSGRLEVLDANGGNVTLLTALTTDDGEPAFLPDSDTIVFTGHAQGSSNLYTVNADGSGLKQLTTTGGSWPAPCANGSIAFVNHGALYVMSGSRHRLRRLARHASTPDCAPNGKSIVYQGRGGDFVVRAKGGKSRRIKGGDGSFPVFSPNGTLIASVQDLPDSESGGASVPSIVVVQQKNGHRVRKQALGDAAGAVTVGPLAWRP